MKYEAKKRLISLLRLFMFVGVAWIGVNHSAYGVAVCNFPNHINMTGDMFNFGSIVVPHDAPDGSAIATTTMILPYECPANPSGMGGFSLQFLGSLRLPTQFPGVGQINTVYEGLYKYTGFRITNMDTGQVMNPVTGSIQEWAPPITSPNPASGSFRIKIELIKLSDGIYNIKQMPNDSRPPISQVRIFDRNYPDQYRYLYLVIATSGGSIKPMPQSCTVTNSSAPPVRLPNISTGDLSYAGATAGDTGFNIGLNCKIGSSVYMTLTDMTDPGNTSDLLTLTPDSTAKGVKLRISRNGKPLRYGPDSRAPGNLNQWYVGPSAATLNIPFSAQYVADGPVSGGIVKGRATFTMSYQ
ncbi:F17G adhesin subunit [Collimonas arenae]|uniref:F17G adhesin subunit n=1 Tax=Collimonas arenae TaxID=279058 RepID=A0A0A1FCZ5_9BURK|nr:fimbrial protein [Collimonas arenae]AIY41650.1 F17G adhesin subunit [Collimonas arenae]